MFFGIVDKLLQEMLVTIQVESLHDCSLRKAINTHSFRFKELMEMFELFKFFVVLVTEYDSNSEIDNVFDG